MRQEKRNKVRIWRKEKKIGYTGLEEGKEEWSSGFVGREKGKET